MMPMWPRRRNQRCKALDQLERPEHRVGATTRIRLDALIGNAWNIRIHTYRIGPLDAQVALAAQLEVKRHVNPD